MTSTIWWIFWLQEGPGGEAIQTIAATASDTVETSENPVQTGDDPADTRCVDDARIVGALDEDGFTVEIIFSPACDAAWGRIARHDDQGHGNRIEVAIYDRDDPEGPSRQQAVEPDIAGAYTMLIVKDSPVQRLCVEGAAFTDGEGIHSDPVCS
ncbi:DUF2690 domain-containing protein [Serinicoccus hydrothermalis]|uniref:DUF2690 domain-containing protein n=1 Tax=Serinicoccus hydrothermalis TaxID=1758689 RepID=UPI00168B6253|nr:DUF2690 domain-containing protein [Serinicoccus hydrothermalis]